MKRVLSSLLVVLLLLCGVTNRAKAFSTPPEKTASGSLRQNPDKRTYVDPLLVLELQRDREVWGYDLGLGVDVGPNLYAYVRQNPWSYFDPLGLELKVTREKHETKEDVTVTNIEFNAVLIDRSKGVKTDDGTYRKRTKSEMEVIKRRTGESIADQFHSKNVSDGNGKEEIRITGKIEVVESSKEIKDQNLHVIEIVDELKSDTGYDHAGEAPIGGKLISLNQGIDNHEQLHRTVSHEFGHTAGLRHPKKPLTEMDKFMKKRGVLPAKKSGYDEKNVLNIESPDTNFMGYKIGVKNIEVKQLEEMARLSSEGKLNQ